MACLHQGHVNIFSCSAIATILSGGLISTLGQFAPYMVIGSILTTVSAGLTYTLSTESNNGQWIGYQVFAGLAIGICFQAPIMAAQALAKDEDIPTTTALIMFFQTAGGALSVSAAQTAFSNEMIKSLLQNVPTVNPAQVIAVGATEIREIFGSEELSGIIQAYMDGLKVIFIFIIAMSGAATAASFAMPWINIKKVTKSDNSRSSNINFGV
jgi:hypothetical protein